MEGTHEYLEVVFDGKVEAEVEKKKKEEEQVQVGENAQEEASREAQPGPSGMVKIKRIRPSRCVPVDVNRYKKRNERPLSSFANLNIFRRHICNEKEKEQQSKLLFTAVVPGIFKEESSKQTAIIDDLLQNLLIMPYKRRQNCDFGFYNVLHSVIIYHYGNDGVSDKDPEVFKDLLELDPAKFGEELDEFKDELYALQLGYLQFKLKNSTDVFNTWSERFSYDVRDRTLRSIASNAQNFLEVSSIREKVLSRDQFCGFQTLIAKVMKFNVLKDSERFVYRY